MSYTDAEVFAATAAMDKYRGGGAGEAGAALVVVGLYFAEFASVRQTGKPITGSEYQRLDNGPAPRRLLPRREILMESGAAELQATTVFGCAQQRLIALREPDMSQFSEDEIEVVDQVVDLLVHAVRRGSS